MSIGSLDKLRRGGQAVSHFFLCRKDRGPIDTAGHREVFIIESALELYAIIFCGQELQLCIVTFHSHSLP